jgi:hypothetical protein
VGDCAEMKLATIVAALLVALATFSVLIISPV